MMKFISGVSEDRRKSPRNRTFLTATVRELNRTSTWSCTVRNICDDGARLEVANSSWLPNQFDLEVMSRDMREPVRVIWRREDALGVAFRPVDRRVSRQLGERVVNLADERDRLRRRITDLTT